MALQQINPTQTKAWNELQLHFHEMQNNSIKEMFAKNPNRVNEFHIKWNDFLIDY